MRRAGGLPRLLTLAGFLRWYWRRISAPAARPALLLVFELYSLALRSPAQYPGVLGDPVDYWRGLVKRSGVARSPDAATATLMLAALRGLLLDLAATGDRARCTRAMHQLAGQVESRR